MKKTKVENFNITILFCWFQLAQFSRVDIRNIQQQRIQMDVLLKCHEKLLITHAPGIWLYIWIGEINRFI